MTNQINRLNDRRVRSLQKRGRYADGGGYEDGYGGYSDGYGGSAGETGDEVPDRENVILVSNHQEMVDIPVLFSFAYAKRRLGDMKFFAKDIIKYVPGFGWGLLFLDCLFVKRNWTSDKEKIDQVLGVAEGAG